MRSKRQIAKFPGQGKTREALHAELKDCMQQQWTPNTYSKYYYDQYGFFIYYNSHYRLEYKGVPITTLHSLSAAKLISTIILNDMIMNKKV